MSTKRDTPTFTDWLLCIGTLLLAGVFVTWCTSSSPARAAAGPAIGHPLGHELSADGIDYGTIDPARLGGDRRVFLYVIYSDGHEETLTSGYGVLPDSMVFEGRVLDGTVRWPGPFADVVYARASFCMWSVPAGGIYNCASSEKPLTELSEPPVGLGLAVAVVMLGAAVLVTRGRL